MQCRAIALVLLLAAGAAPAGAAAGAGGFEDIDRLEARVVAALDAPVGTPGGPIAHIDHRLKLAACPVPVTIDPPALGALPLRCEPLGWRLRVPLQRVAQASTQGGFVPQAIVPSQPVVPPIIKRGDPVQLIAGTDGFSVSTAGVAQEDGRAGGRVRVRTDPRGPILIGDVVDAGQVRIASF